MVLLPITTIVMLTVMIGCWHYSLFLEGSVSRQGDFREVALHGPGRYQARGSIRSHALTKSDTVMNFEIATEGLHEAISKHVMLYHPIISEFPLRPFIIETPRMMTRKSTVGPPN